MIPPDDSNPYAAPSATVDAPRRERSTVRLASLGQRFVGAMIDGLFFVILMVVMLVMDPALMDALANDGTTSEPVEPNVMSLAILGLGFVGFFIVQMFLLATRSQSIGKIVAKTRIDKVDGSDRAPWVNAILLRSFVPGIISVVPFVGSIFSLVDVLFIFRADRRCIHDLIAGTVVNRVR